jgi:hypothetical protein
MKILKILACYFGKRRAGANNPANEEEVYNIILENIRNHQEYDYGTDLDLCIVINTTTSPIESNYVSKIFKYENADTMNGVIKVLLRDNSLGGGSFGAFSFGFDILPNYDYYFFCEDDAIFDKGSFITEAVDLLQDKSIGYVALTVINDKNYPAHCTGGIGITSKENIMKVHNGDIPFTKSLDYEDLQRCEISFSNAYVRHGLKLVNLNSSNPYPSNFYKHSALVFNYNQGLRKGIDRPYIYRIGNSR